MQSELGVTISLNKAHHGGSDELSRVAFTHLMAHLSIQLSSVSLSLVSLPFILTISKGNPHKSLNKQDNPTNLSKNHTLYPNGWANDDTYPQANI